MDKYIMFPDTPVAELFTAAKMIEPIINNELYRDERIVAMKTEGYAFASALRLNDGGMAVPFGYTQAEHYIRLRKNGTFFCTGVRRVKNTQTYLKPSKALADALLGTPRVDDMEFSIRFSIEFIKCVDGLVNVIAQRSSYIGYDLLTRTTYEEVLAMMRNLLSEDPSYPLYLQQKEQDKLLRSFIDKDGLTVDIEGAKAAGFAVQYDKY